uniref:Uncharacterized protein n=1 Tax=Anguilla anguilla TaxID=7936 RepID=A0A0E9S1H7_ANGAN
MNRPCALLSTVSLVTFFS